MINKIIAIYPGRFQPMARHHAEAFTWLQNKFGAGNTYIATSDITDPVKSPFSFQEKKEIISKFGFGNKIVQTKRPYKAEEITYKFNPDTTAVVYMVGEKDMKENPRFKIGTTKEGNPTYFQDYEKNKKNLQGFETHAYLVVAPHVSLNIPGYGEISGTEVRNILSKQISDTERPELFRKIFGWYDSDVADMMISKLNTKKNMKEQIFTSKWWKHVFESSVNEIGDASMRPYKWEEVDQEGRFTYVRFITEKGTEYEVDIERMKITNLDDNKSLNSIGIEFLAKPGKREDNGYSSKIILNKGELYKVMSTIADIIKKYIKKYKVEAITYSPSAKSETEFGQQRDNLYKLFIKKALPGVTFHTKKLPSGLHTVAILPNNNITEGYPTAKQAAAHKKKIEKLKSYLRSNIGKEFIYDFNEFPKTVYGVKITEGGVSGHMDHVFDIDWVKTGDDLIQAFEQSIDYLTKKPAAVKIDGINTSIRLVTLNNKKQFVLDRGSMKSLDVQGVTKDDLMGRFGEGHGMIKIGGIVLDIFNKSLPSIAPALKKLGLWDNPNILLNIEYVSGATNVVSYSNNFLAIHGLLELYRVTEKRRATKEIPYDKSAMQDLLNNLVPVASQYDYEVVGSINTTLSSRPNLTPELNKRYTITYNTGTKETKTLRQWLANAKIDNVYVKTIDGKTISSLSKEVLTKLLNNIPLDEFIADTKDYKPVIDGFFIYLATMYLGDVILDKLTSKIGNVKEHEGIVIRDTKISSRPFKITGAFILKGLESIFRKK